MITVKVKKIAKSKPMVAIEENGKVRWVKVKPDIFKHFNTDVKIDDEISVDIEEKKGEVPIITSLRRENEDISSDNEVEIEEVNVDEHPPLKKENTSSNQDTKFLKEITAQTIQVLVGKVDIDNIEETIRRIYNTYKEL